MFLVDAALLLFSLLFCSSSTVTIHINIHINRNYRGIRRHVMENCGCWCAERFESDTYLCCCCCFFFSFYFYFNLNRKRERILHSCRVRVMKQRMIKRRQQSLWWIYLIILHWWLKTIVFEIPHTILLLVCLLIDAVKYSKTTDILIWSTALKTTKITTATTTTTTF